MRKVARRGKRAGRNAGTATERADESTVTRIVTDGNDNPKRQRHESPAELIRRLAVEFYPLPVAALARPYLAKTPFDSRGLVMSVTRAWRELPFSLKPSKLLRLTLARKERGL